jgi:hypothetical protein
MGEESNKNACTKNNLNRLDGQQLWKPGLQSDDVGITISSLW